MSRKFVYSHELHSRTIEKDILDGMEGGDINSREELLAIAEEEGLQGEIIRWDVWDKVVQQTKEIIEEVVGDETMQSKQLKAVYAYDLNTGEEIGQYSSAQEASEALSVIKGTIAHCACTQKPLKKANMYFSYTPLTPAEVKKHSLPANNYHGGTPVEKYVYDLNCKLLGHYKSTQEASDILDIPPRQVNYLAWRKRPYWMRKIIILSEPMNEKIKRSLDIQT